MFFSYFRPVWCICHIYHMVKNYCNNCGFLLLEVISVQCLRLSRLLIPLICLGKPHIKIKNKTKLNNNNKKTHTKQRKKANNE